MVLFRLDFLQGELSSEVQHLFWRGKVETLSGSVVEHLHHFFNFLGRNLMEVGPSWEELPHKTIQVLNRWFLPGGMWPGEVEWNVHFLLYLLVAGKFFAAVSCYSLHWQFPAAKQKAKSTQCFF